MLRVLSSRCGGLRCDDRVFSSPSPGLLLRRPGRRRQADGTPLRDRRPSNFLIRVGRRLDRCRNTSGVDEARNDGRFVLERFTYASDGLEVSAYLYRPDQAAGPLPLVVFNRGSYVVKDQAPVLLATFRRIAIEGFVVLAPMLRGSDGMEGRDEMGAADLHDIANAIVRRDPRRRRGRMRRSSTANHAEGS